MVRAPWFLPTRCQYYLHPRLAPSPHSLVTQKNVFRHRHSPTGNKSFTRLRTPGLRHCDGVRELCVIFLRVSTFFHSPPGLPSSRPVTATWRPSSCRTQRSSCGSCPYSPVPTSACLENASSGARTGKMQKVKVNKSGLVSDSL